MNSPDDESYNNGAILYVCLSDHWGSSQRALFNDIRYSLDEGHNVIIYTLRDTFVDLYAKKLRLKIIYHSGKTNAHVLRWHRFRNIPKIINAHDIKMVHCYELDFVWPMSFFLRKNLHIPLFLTLFDEIRTKYSSFIYSLLSSRIDHIFIPFSPLEKNIRGQLRFDGRKVVSLGFGVEKIDQKCQALDGVNSAWAKELDEIWSMGAYVPPHFKNIKPLETAIYAVMGINQKLDVHSQVKLVLASEKKWSETLIYPDLIRFLKDLGVENLVLFYTCENISQLIPSMDLWLGAIGEQYLDDLSIRALIEGVPIVIPRTSSSMEIFRIFGTIGETYKADDSRQLRDQCIKIVTEKSHYTRQLKKVIPALENAFGVNNYQQRLMHFYYHCMQVRKRFSRQKQLIF